MDYKKARKIYAVLVWVVVAMVFISGVAVYISQTIGMILFILSMVAFAGVIAFGFRYLRCPHCDGFLALHRFMSMWYCPYCGKELEK